MRPLAIITGGTSGIGLGTALRIANRYDIALIYKDRHKNAEDAAAQVRKQHPKVQVEVFAQDLKDQASARAVKTFVSGKFEAAPEVLINSAGYTEPNLFMMTQFQKFLEIYQTHVLGVAALIGEILPLMYRKKKGRIVNLSSIASDGTKKGLVSYGSAKAAIEAITKSLAVELKGKGITVNAIKPGMVVTPMTDSVGHLFNSMVPVDHVAAMIEYLLSPEADFITGSIFTIDNGTSLAPFDIALSERISNPNKE